MGLSRQSNGEIARGIRVHHRVLSWVAIPDTRVTMIKITPLKALIVGLVALLMPICLSAQELRPHSILVLDQSDGGPFYFQLLSGLRNVVSSRNDAHVTLYSDSLDLSRFGGQAYEESLKRYLQEKYRGRPIGAIVSIGAATTELVLRWRDELWPGIPVVFAMLDEMDVARLKPPPDVTGVIVKLPLANAVKVARAVVPGLDTIALVGDAWDQAGRLSQLGSRNCRRCRRSCA